MKDPSPGKEERARVPDPDPLELLYHLSERRVHNKSTQRNNFVLQLKPGTGPTRTGRHGYRD
jgi:hypothetical protein